MNRRKHTAARQSAARIMTVTAWTGAATLAALAWTACASASARWTDDATAHAVAYILRNESCTLGEIDAAPRELRAAVWLAAGQRWTAARESLAIAASDESFIARHTTRRSAQETAASARVLDFARGYADTVDERDLMDASPAAVRAAIDSGRLD